ncbi:MAG: fibronectin type III domain-containing protein, partial [Verrucomicrobiae bacterium]
MKFPGPAPLERQRVTHYDFLHAPKGQDATPATIVSDIEATATRFNKLRFGISAPSGPNANSSVRPFFDAAGNPALVETARPNPSFFRQRVDSAVQHGFDLDLICDLILEIADNQLATNTIFLRYVAARYGSYPNVWFCLGNESLEFNTAAQVNSAGTTLRAALPYPSPVSDHMVRGWDAGLSGSWYSHTINQYKLDQHFHPNPGNLGAQADRQVSEYKKSNVRRPVINDECAYDPNEATELQAIESAVGCFLGGAYSSSGEKTASKQGGYFWGHSAVGTTINAHPSSDNLGWLRQKIDQHIPFWTLSPSTPAIFGNLATQFRTLAATGSLYVLGSNSALSGITATLPAGTWGVRQLDAVAMTDTLLDAASSGTFTFSTPASVAGLTIFRKNEVLQIPAPPTSLAATPVSSTRINLTWSDPATKETSYQLQRRLHTDAAWADLAARLPADTTTYSDNSVTQTLTYDYRLRAVNSDGPSPWSAEVSATALLGTTPEILLPTPGTTFAPLSPITLTGVGTDLVWAVSGAATASGTGASLTFTVPASATNGQSITVALAGSGTQTQRTFAIADSAPQITTTTAQLATATANQLYGDDIEATGGDGAITISLLSGTLPPGLTILNNNLTGTPSMAGTYSFVVQAQDADGDTSTAAPLTLT